MNDSLMLSQLITAKRMPALAQQMVHAMQSARMIRLNKARATRNFFLRIVTRPFFVASGPDTVSVRTPALAYPYMIVAISGGMPSTGNATIHLRMRFESEMRLQLSEEDLRAETLIGGGDFWNVGMQMQEEPMYLPIPIPMAANEQATIDFVVGQPVDTLQPELTLHCVRALDASSYEAQLPPDWAHLAETQIKSYLPRMVYLRTEIDYGAIPPDGRFKSEFVKVPLLLLGATSSLAASRLELRDEMSGYEFMPAVGNPGTNDTSTFDKGVPSWVIAPNKNHSKAPIYWFQRPHLLIPGTRLSVKATDGLDLQDPAIAEVNFVPAPPPNPEIVWICQTV